MPRAPTPNDEPSRLAALRQCRILDTTAEPQFDELAGLAARRCGTPVAAVSLVDVERQWFKASCGLPVSQLHRDDAICGYTVLARNPTVIQDLTTDPRTSDHPFVTGPPHIRFYAGAPLLVGSGYAVGTLLIMDTRPRALEPQVVGDLAALARLGGALLELRRTTFALEESQAAAAINSASQVDFIANISQVIGTSMTAILGYIDMMLEPGAAPDEQASHAATIRRNANRLMAVTGDILDLASFEAGQVRLEYAACDLRTELEDVLAQFRSRADKKGLRLNSRYSTGLPQCILTDATRFRQIIYNLVSNAVKFTDEGAVELQVHSLPGLTPNSVTLCVEVADSGPGISPEQLNRVFQCIRPSEPGATRRIGGAGLGLAISKRLAQLLGGELSVHSQPGKGSLFTLRLDVAVAIAHGVPPAPAAAQFVEPASKNAALTESIRGRVLLAEDGPDNQRLIAMILQKAGLEVTVVQNGQQAIEQALVRSQSTDPESVREPFDLLLLDMQMPEIDGYTAARLLRCEGYRGVIIGVTAHGQVGDRDRCLAAGCNDYVRKPIQREALIQTCRRWLQKLKPLVANPPTDFRRIVLDT